MLQTISQIAIIIFAGLYILGTFWKPSIIRKKRIFKGIIQKNKIDLYSMEIHQAFLKKMREKAIKERETIEQQIKDLEELKAEKEKEMAQLKTTANGEEDWKEVEDKNKEIVEIDNKIEMTSKDKAGNEVKTGLRAEIREADKIILLAQSKIGEYTHNMSLIEKSLQESKSLYKELCK